MNEDFNHIIIKYLTKEASKIEEKKFLELISKNEKARKEFEEFKMIWKKSKRLKTKFNSEKAWNILKDKIEKKQVLRRILWRVAAVFVGLIVLSSFLYLDYSHTETIYASNKIRKYIFPDSSVIYLNKNSQINFKKSMFFTFDRKVKLKGEAYFEITKRKGRKFTVLAQNLNVQVLGTKFNVRTNKEQSEVVLSRGKVRLFNFKNTTQEVIMHPGDYVSYNAKSNKINKQIVNPLVYTIWRKNQLIFNDFSLEEIARIINNQFGKTLIIRNKLLLNKHLKGSAPSDDLKILIEALSEIINRKIINRNDTIIIE